MKPRARYLCAAALLGCATLMFDACAERQPDHFYVLSAQPSAPAGARTAPATAVVLRVNVASVFDRVEMTLNTSQDSVSILEHARWAAPLSDLMRDTLARDLEARRSDLLVTGQRSGHPDTPSTRVAVDVVQLNLRLDQGASFEARWHIVGPGRDQTGGDVFTAASGAGAADGHAALADALSRCLGSLADRLIEQMK